MQVVEQAAVPVDELWYELRHRYLRVCGEQVESCAQREAKTQPADEDVLRLVRAIDRLFG